MVRGTGPDTTAQIQDNHSKQWGAEFTMNNNYLGSQSIKRIVSVSDYDQELKQIWRDKLANKISDVLLSEEGRH